MLEHDVRTPPPITIRPSQPIRPASRRRRRLIAAMAAAAVGMGSYGAWALQRDDNVFPLEAPRVSYATDQLAPKDPRFSLAALLIEDPGADVEIIDVQARTSSNVKVLGAYAMWPNKPYPQAGGPSFPIAEQPKKYRHAVGQPIPASVFRKATAKLGKKSFASVTVGFRIVEGKIGAVNGVLVTYRVDGRTKHQFFSQSLVGCIKPVKCTGTAGLANSNTVLEHFGLLPA
jgi:hypothetical protein